VDAIDDMDDSTLELLGSRVSKLAGNGGKNRLRERRPSDREFAPPKSRRSRDRDT
jgi:hypothetical protein